MLLAKRTPSGASCLEPRLKLQVSLVQGRLAVFLPSPVRSFGIQHANHTRTVFLPTHATAKYGQPQHPSRSHLSCRPVKAASCPLCSGHVRSSYRRQTADSTGVVLTLSVVNHLFLCCGPIANCSLRPFVRPSGQSLLTSQQYSHTPLGNHTHYF